MAHRWKELKREIENFCELCACRQQLLHCQPLALVPERPSLFLVRIVMSAIFSAVLDNAYLGGYIDPPIGATGALAFGCFLRSKLIII
jgi:hypothetical protein